MSFTNVYYKRTTATAKACFICYKPTTTVLATINAVDFVYTCSGHLSDPGFASPIASESSKPALSAEEIAKIKEEYEEKQRKKAEKEKEKEKAKVVTPASPATPSHEKFQLHRDFFAMRLQEHRKRRQTAQAKELAPRFPGVPL
ncbi:AAA-ATPase Vps4-associated protein 1-domain-containing protein [Mycena floridula]|nr:AAA-ATPase Vps4-associated protein 1-domain-containing protein [Mycena floridula]